MITALAIISALSVLVNIFIGKAVSKKNKIIADRDKTIEEKNIEITRIKDNIKKVSTAIEVDNEMEVAGNKIDKAIQEATSAEEVSNIRSDLAHAVSGLL